MAGRAKQPLTREQIHRAALRLADERGLAAVTMRSLAGLLGVQPMSLYHHVAGKEALLDEITDAVFAQIELPRPGAAWRPELERRAHSARQVLRAHPWALALLETRTSPGVATLRHHDAVIGVLREAGFSLPLTGHAMSILDAFVHGFVLQETALPFDTASSASQRADLAAQVLAGHSSENLPHLSEFMHQYATRPGYDLGASFDVGLGLLLDGLEAARQRG